MKTSTKKDNGKRPGSPPPPGAPVPETGVQYYAVADPVLKATLATLQNELPMAKVRGLVEALEAAPSVVLKVEKGK